MRVPDGLLSPVSSYPFEVGPYLIDNDRYYSPEYMQREWAELWPHVWLMAGFTADLAKPGDFVVFDIGPESVLVTRDEAGEVHAFHNVCTHRGTRLSNCAGHTKSGFRCGYHGWQFALDGRLVSVPDAAGFPHKIGKERARLGAVRCDIWAGMVWVHFGEPTQTLREYLGPVPGLAAPYHPEDFAITSDFTTHWDWNWKTALDAFSETYHVTATHAQLLEAVDPLLAEFEHYGLHGLLRVPIGPLGPNASRAAVEDPIILRKLAAEGVDIAPHAHTSVDERRAALQQALRRNAVGRGIDYSGLADWQLTDTNQFFLFPNLHFDFHGADSFTIFRYRPHPTDPQRCSFDNVDFVRVHARSPRQAHRVPHRELSYDELPQTIQQDADVMALMHRGRLSRGFSSPVMHEAEARIVDIHRNIDRYLAGERGVPESHRVSPS